MKIALLTLLLVSSGCATYTITEPKTGLIVEVEKFAHTADIGEVRYVVTSDESKDANTSSVEFTISGTKSDGAGVFSSIMKFLAGFFAAGI